MAPGLREAASFAPGRLKEASLDPSSLLQMAALCPFCKVTSVYPCSLASCLEKTTFNLSCPVKWSNSLYSFNRTAPLLYVYVCVIYNWQVPWTQRAPKYPAHSSSWEDRLSFKECVRTCSVAQLCLTLCNPVDCSLPGSSVHKIVQARILQWVAVSSSRGSSGPRD